MENDKIINKRNIGFFLHIKSAYYFLLLLSTALDGNPTFMGRELKGTACRPLYYDLVAGADFFKWN